ncbi:uncharacterized protein LOC143055291 [Mytilus galloprovincialis]|uniref:uncharacterized protein LOC143055291 n=1 Tax=Mytilus galloprovincialis TaxID=29158 RepID=UPI003F7B7E4C
MATAKPYRAASLSDLPNNFQLGYLNCEISLKCKQTGFKYFSEGYIHNVKMLKQVVEQTVNISAKCHRSQRKNEIPHSVEIDVNGGQIELSNCSCTAGLSGCCSHIVGLIQGLVQWQMMGLTEPPAELFCTSLPQQWGKPRGKEIKAVPAPSMIIVKPKMDRKRKPLKNSLIDNRKIQVKESDISYLNSLKGYPISYLAHNTPVMQDTSYGPFPLGSALSTQADFYSEREIVPVETVCGDLVFPKENGQSVLSEKYNTLIDTISNDEVNIIEEQTREQAQCEKWFKEREKRITASNFHRIVKRKAAINDTFILSIMKPKPFTSKATSYEIKARNSYVQTSGHHVHDCGFVVNPRYPFIGATPDAKICDNGVTGIMEIKCPFSQRDNLITDAMQGADFCLELSENGPKLKISHDYFIQVKELLIKIFDVKEMAGKGFL